RGLLEVRDTLRRRVAGEDNLFSRLVEVVEGVEELLLCPLFSCDELNVIDQQEVDRPVARAEGGRVVVANRIDELIGEVLGREIDDHRAGKQANSPVTNRVEQVRLAEADAAIDEQRV